MELPQTFGLQLEYPCVLAIHPISCSMQNAHTLYMDLNDLVSIQIKFNFLQLNIFTYIHFQCQWAISMEAKLVYKNVA
jgi:hypothetical protein